MTTKHDERDIHDMLITRDVAAFCRCDWESVSSDFDAESFVGYRGADPHDWELAFPTLTAYRDAWLEQARTVTVNGPDDLHDQLLAAQTLTRIQIDGDRALVRKTFDGTIVNGDVTDDLDWETFYFLLKQKAGWTITGFVGYLPRASSSDHDVRSRPEQPSSPIIEHESAHHRTAGPYRPVLTVRSGSIVVISGQGPLDDDGHVIGDTVEQQTIATLENCRRQLYAAGAGLDNVFKVNVYLRDLGDWPSFNEAYAAVMPDALPVRTVVEAGLLLGMRVEIEMWAAL